MECKMDRKEFSLLIIVIILASGADTVSRINILIIILKVLHSN